MNRTSVLFRLLIGVGILVVAGYAGFVYRSPWIVPWLGLAFCGLYIQGKWPAWRALWRARGAAGWALALATTLPIQTLLAGIFYVLGLGMRGLLLGGDSAREPLSGFDAALVGGMFIVATLLAAFVRWIEVREGHGSGDPAALEAAVASVRARVEAGLADPSPQGTAQGAAQARDVELDLDPAPVELFRLFRARHFSQQNYTAVALRDVVDHMGDRPLRRPRAASEAMLGAAEARLGRRLPDALRALYRVQDGGIVESCWVPKVPRPQPVYQDWADAFAYDYDELKPLRELRTLHDLYMEGFDPEYSDEDEKEHWLPGCEDLVVLCARTGCGTALDYRVGPDPGVLIFDLEAVGDARVRVRFDTFDGFVAALRMERDDRDGGPREEVLEERVDAAHAERFWDSSASTTARGVDSASWRATGERLGVTPPAELLPFYRVTDGGTTRFANDPAVAPQREGRIGTPFPEEVYVDRGRFLEVAQWVSLQTLSERLDFIDRRAPWAQLWPEPERLIVIAAAFDSAILLDYRDGRASPALLVVQDLDDPERITASYASVAEFLSRLRAVGVPGRPPTGVVGDPRVSVRRAAVETFWAAAATRPPVDAADVEAFAARYGRALPRELLQFFEVHDGGPVRFRFLPPESTNAHGYVNQQPSESPWLELCPNGLLPLRDWRPLVDWCAARGLPFEQAPAELASRSMSTDTELDFAMFVIGVAGPEAHPVVTLFDLSTSFFNRERSILRVDYAGEAKARFDVVISHKSVTHAFQGLFGQLRALRSELPAN